MKKVLAILAVLVSMYASAYDVTNTVTIISNIYYRIGEEHWITNNVKNTHANYFYTNNVYTVSNQTLLVSQTNINTSVTVDIGNVMLAKMSNEVDRANLIVSNASDFASAASVSAGDASFYANKAHTSELQAQAVVGTVNTRRDQIIAEMNAKQDWFDQNYGKLITNEVYETHTYFPNLETNYIDGAGHEHKDLLVSLPKLAILSVGGTNFTLKLWCASVSGTPNTLVFDRVVGDDGSYAVHMRNSTGLKIWSSPYGTYADLYLDDMYYNGTAWVAKLHRNGVYFEATATTSFIPSSRVSFTKPSDQISMYLESNGQYSGFSKVADIATTGTVDTRIDSKIIELNLRIGDAFSSVTNRFIENENRIAALENKDYSNDRIVHYASTGKIYKRYHIFTTQEVSGQQMKVVVSNILIDNNSYTKSGNMYNFTIRHDDMPNFLLNRVSKYAIGTNKNMYFYYTNNGTTDYLWITSSDPVISNLPPGPSVAGYATLPVFGQCVIYAQYIEDVYVEEERHMDYFISSDFNVYDASSNVIDRLVRMSQLNSFSNWVEQTFQKR